MLRSLWTSASGMIAQQTHLDVVSHNLANVNTQGYKKRPQSDHDPQPDGRSLRESGRR